MRRKWSAWSRISDAVRLRPNFICPVAQKLQVSGHPDCELTQIERRPSRNRISTASSERPSSVWNSAFRVPSSAVDSVASSSADSGTRSASRSRRSAGRLVISP